MHGLLRRDAGRDIVQLERLERRQHAAVERSGKSRAAGVGDLGLHEVEQLELLQPTSRQRQRTCRRRKRRHEGGDNALVAERVAYEEETRQRGQPPRGISTWVSAFIYLSLCYPRDDPDGLSVV